MKTLYYNGNIIPMTGTELVEAIVIGDGKILYVGSIEEAEKLLDATDSRVNLDGHTLLPGFIDPHSHLSAVGYQLLICDCSAPPKGDCKSTEDVVNKLKVFLRSQSIKDGQWLVGMGYDQSQFENEKHPTKEDLDEVSTEIPILVTHTSGHLAVVNTMAFSLLGYNVKNPKVPSGGVVESSGLLKEEAFLAAEKQAKIKGPSADELLDSIGKASILYASYGITTLQDAKVRKMQAQILSLANEKGLIKNDLVLYYDYEEAKIYLREQSPKCNVYRDSIKDGGVKFFLDGSPQGKTAWLSKPYYVVPEGEQEDYCGFGVHDDRYLINAFSDCIEHHYQINVHANGDEAIEQMIRCYAKALENTKSKEDLRPVIIHCQLVREDQLTRMKDIGLLASFFVDHIYYWGDYYIDSIVGKLRAERISPLQSAIRHQISFTLHEDSPVVMPDILFTVHTAVNRKTANNITLGEQEKISAYDALKAFTVNAAYQIFEEDRKGTLEKGKRADLVILDRNPLNVDKETIKDISVLETIKDGRTIYRKPL